MTHTDPEWHRHHTTRAGQNFRDAIWLDGFDVSVLMPLGIEIVVMTVALTLRRALIRV